MSNCEQFKLDLPLYFDDVLAPEERSAIDSHLSTCPLCRQKIEDMQSIRLSLRNMPAVPIPDGLAASLQAKLLPDLQTHAFHPVFRLVEAPRNWVQVWLMPSVAGGFVTMMVGASLLWFMVGHTRPTPPTGPEIVLTGSGIGTDTPVFLAGGPPSVEEFANSRRMVAAESPSLNPQGALVSLTETLLGKELPDDEVVVVADVYENGSARIAQVVEPSHDRKAVKQLERALESELAYAPFVPAELDARPATMQVIFKIRSVNVYANSGATSP